MRVCSPGLLAALLLAIVPPGSTGSAEAPASGRLHDQAALKPYGGLVGAWRGVGQPERGKAKGAWTESAAWAWKLTQDSAALEAEIAKGKYLKSFVLRPGKEPGTFTLAAVLPDGSKRAFTGKSADRKRLVLTADSPEGEGVKRITITPLHDTRLLVLLESQDADRGGYARLGEVGYTRQGVAFAAGESGPTCIVTDGRGTIAVSYKGMTYHVCCTGCRDLFNENPEAVLAEAAQRKKDNDGK
jgi:YHS domain-containing protein